MKKTQPAFSGKSNKSCAAIDFFFFSPQTESGCEGGRRAVGHSAQGSVWTLPGGSRVEEVWLQDQTGAGLRGSLASSPLRPRRHWYVAQTNAPLQRTPPAGSNFILTQSVTWFHRNPARVFKAETFTSLFAVQFNSNRLGAPAALWAVGTDVFMKLCGWWSLTASPPCARLERALSGDVRCSRGV